jgi:hypothetical protein
MVPFLYTRQNDAGFCLLFFFLRRGLLSVWLEEMALCAGNDLERGRGLLGFRKWTLGVVSAR